MKGHSLFRPLAVFFRRHAGVLRPRVRDSRTRADAEGSARSSSVSDSKVPRRKPVRQPVPLLRRRGSRRRPTSRSKSSPPSRRRREPPHAPDPLDRLREPKTKASTGRTARPRQSSRARKAAAAEPTPTPQPEKAPGADDKADGVAETTVEETAAAVPAPSPPSTGTPVSDEATAEEPASAPAAVEQTAQATPEEEGPLVAAAVAGDERPVVAEPAVAPAVGEDTTSPADRDASSTPSTDERGSSQVAGRGAQQPPEGGTSAVAQAVHVEAPPVIAEPSVAPAAEESKSHPATEPSVSSRKSPARNGDASSTASKSVAPQFTLHALVWRRPRFKKPSSVALGRPPARAARTHLSLPDPRRRPSPASLWPSWSRVRQPRAARRAAGARPRASQRPPTAPREQSPRATGQCASAAVSSSST